MANGAPAEAFAEVGEGLIGDGSGLLEGDEVGGQLRGVEGGEDGGGIVGIDAGAKVGELFPGESRHGPWWIVSKKKESVEKIVLTVVKKRRVMG